MAINAGDGQMAARQHKSTGLVPRQGVGRRRKAIHRVATFASACTASKLTLMDVLVAGLALRGLDLEECCLPGREMALVALHALMLSQERIAGSRVFLHSKR
jgi:hypothetical protein